MPLETATYISELVPTNPPGTDYGSTLDDHIRLVKGALQNTFPNLVQAANPTDAEFNLLVGKTALLDPTQTGSVDYAHNIRVVKANPYHYLINNSGTGAPAYRLYPSSAWYGADLTMDGIADALYLRKRRQADNNVSSYLHFTDSAVDVNPKLTVAGGNTYNALGPSVPDVAWYGTGADGVFNSTASTSIDSGEHWFTDFTLNSGHTLTLNGYGGIIIRATGTITIDGTIAFQGRAAHYYFSTTSSSESWQRAAGHGGIGGGGGAGGTYYDAGASTYRYGYVGLGSFFALGGAPTTGTGGNGSSLFSTQARTALSSLALALGGGSPGGRGGNNGAVGGRGGGAIILIAPTVVINTGAVLDVRGYAGGNSSVSSQGSGGGGGGGLVVLAAESLTNAGNIYTSGGAGGVGGAANGGAGGNGALVTVQL